MKLIKISGGRREGIFMPDHPHVNCNGYIPYSRYLMEQKIGRLLNQKEHIHHINENPLDNRIENLLLMTQSEHIGYHNSRRYKFKFDKENKAICRVCNQRKDKSEFRKDITKLLGCRNICKKCDNEYTKDRRRRGW